MKKNILNIISTLLLMAVLFPQEQLFAQMSKAEEIFSKMSLEEKLAQLLVVRVRVYDSESENQKILADIKRAQPGGACFYKGTPYKEADFTNRLQAVSKVPMIISMDAEWGPAMRMDSCVTFPRHMTLGALSAENDSLIYQMGLEMASQCKALGINVNYAPCVDINNNANNPTINSRSFGENRDNVVRKASLFLNGMQDGGVIGCLKHFPGHGDTHIDSHLSLPTIKKSRKELDEFELYPYKKLLNQNVDMVMIGHLNIPVLDPAKNSVSSMSYPIITKLLKQEFGFDGIVITDGMEMRSVRMQNRFNGDTEVRALLAGVDIILLAGQPTTIVANLKSAVNKGLLPIAVVNDRCLRVLKFKERHGLLEYTPIELDSVHNRLNTTKALDINNKLEQYAVTMLKNEDHILPLNRIPEDTLRADSVLLLCIGRLENKAAYQELAKKYGLAYRQFKKNLPIKGSGPICQEILNSIKPYNRIILAFGGSNQLAAQEYGIDSNMIDLLNKIAQEKRVVLIHFGNPYSLNLFDSTTNYKAILVTYQSTPNSLDAALKACLGQMVCKGILPVSNNEYSSGFGLTTKIEDENLSTLPNTITTELDRILCSGIDNQIYPGCVLLSLKNGKTIYHKAFGHQTYDHQNEMKTYTMYDVSSITQTAATTLAVMKLYDKGQIKLTDHIGDYLSYLRGSNKAKISLAELLTHTSGMPATIPFYTKIQSDKKYIRNRQSSNFGIKVADNLYLRNDYPDTMRYEIANCTLGDHQYEYSDLNMVLLKDMVEQITGKTIEEFLFGTIYGPMGLTRTCFNPLSYGFTKSEIAPTENDTLFRKQVVHGYVNDLTAALFNGNAGNAGLFTTAEDLAKIYQMLLNGGSYEGKHYFSEKTVKLFTSPYEIHGNKTCGLGFHTPNNIDSSELVLKDASKKIFGDQGVNGCTVWCDPETKLIFVFLSNRICPDRYPDTLSTSNIKLTTLKKIYEGVSSK